MLQLRLLLSIFKASLVFHTLKTFTKLWTKLNRTYASCYVPKLHEISFTIYVNAAQSLLQVKVKT